MELVTLEWVSWFQPPQAPFETIGYIPPAKKLRQTTDAPPVRDAIAA